MLASNEQRCESAWGMGRACSEEARCAPDSAPGSGTGAGAGAAAAEAAENVEGRPNVLAEKTCVRPAAFAAVGASAAEARCHPSPRVPANFVRRGRDIGERPACATRLMLAAAGWGSNVDRSLRRKAYRKLVESMGQELWRLTLVRNRGRVHSSHRRTVQPASSSALVRMLPKEMSPQQLPLDNQEPRTHLAVVNRHLLKAGRHLRSDHQAQEMRQHLRNTLAWGHDECKATRRHKAP